MLKRILPLFLLCIPAHPSAALDLKDPAIVRAAGSIREDAIRAAMRFLADDLLEGREAGSRGYDVAAQYMAAQMESLGLEPAGDSGTWFQHVPFRAARVFEDQSAVSLVRGSEVVPLQSAEDYLLGVNFFEDDIEVTDASLVFVGYGVSAPEFKYDDFSGVDVQGKVVVSLKGAPPTFPNDQRAYYSSTTVKNGIAASRGAIGVITILRPEEWKTAPWSRMVDRKDETGMRWSRDGIVANAFERIRFQVLMSEEGAEKLFVGARRSLAAVFETAMQGKAQSFALPWRIRARQRGELKELRSANVVGVLRGSDPALAGEYLVYTAHLDHEGIGRPVNGDAVFNGAYDNASGCATLLEVARAFSSMPVRPRRSIIFAAVTGEEKGLQGAEYFVSYPPVPIGAIVANLNMDMFLALFPVADVVGFGAEHSSLGGVLEQAAAESGFKVIPDFAPQEVVFIRSDQFPFVKKGIPALFVTSGTGSEDPAIDGARETMDWLEGVYHGRGDDLSQRIDYPSLARFAKLNFLAGTIVANEEARPNWNAGDFFGDKFGKR